MKSFFVEYSKLIGLLLLGFVLISLLSTPSMLLAKTITTIDTELSRASEDVNFVRAKMDFGNVLNKESEILNPKHRGLCPRPRKP